jgi:formamidopyrimidine-DNA glycosylase
MNIEPVVLRKVLKSVTRQDRVTLVSWRDAKSNQVIKTFSSVYGPNGPVCLVCGRKIGSKSCLIMHEP